MRILFITYQGDVSGATNSLTYLTLGMAKKGHQIFVACRKEALLFKNLENTEVQLIAMEFRRKFELKNIRHLKRIILHHQIDIVNAQSSWDRYSSIFARWIYRLKVKIVHTRRQSPMSMGGFLQNFLYTYGTDKIVAVSREVKQELVKKGLPESHIEVIHNGTPIEKYNLLDPDYIDNLKSKFNIQSGDFVIGCVSRLKKQEQLLQALNYLTEEVKLIFVGIEEKSEFQSIISGYPVPHKIYFEGNINGLQVLNYYKIFDVHILPSTMEGLSQSLLEAMALEVPVIATAAAGNLDLIKDGENGLLYEDRNFIQLAEKIKFLMNNKNLRSKLKEKGRITALEDFSMEQTIKGYENFFSGLIEEKN
jgi:L-malate glycosyltransferase